MGAIHEYEYGRSPHADALQKMGMGMHVDMNMNMGISGYEYVHGYESESTRI